ncbi:MAG: penicillin-binding protein 2 [Cellvibrionaceae bacterium]
MAEPLQLKDHYNETRIFIHRLWCVILFVLILIGVLVFRYYNLQITHHQNYATQSDRNRIHVQPIPPTRGLIYDRNGQLLAENQPSYTLTVIKERVDDLDRTLDLLASIISISENDLERFQKNLAKRRRPFEAIPLRFKLNEDEIAKLAVNKYRLEGVEVEAQLVRHYPYGELFAHSIGYVGRINDVELSQFSEEQVKAYEGTYSIGKIGIEKQYENTLLGNVGYQNVETNARGRVLKELERSDPTPGEDLHLFLDAEVQKAAQEALGDNRGAVVAIDVRNGGVIAIASTPSFDPNLFVTGISVKDYNRLRNSKDIPLFDRPLQGQYPPGSTLKPMLGLGGLHTGFLEPSRTIVDYGFYKLPGQARRYRDHIAWGHGKKVDLRQAIIESCNTFYYDLAYRMGIDNIYAFGSQFGLGKKTGIDLPSERRGNWPSREWKRDARGLAWYPGDSLNVGVGQGFVLTTPLQLAVMASTMAMRGELRAPRIVSDIIPPRLLEVKSALQVAAEESSLHRISNNVVEAHFPMSKLEVKEEHWDYVHSAMEQVIHGKKGTARRISHGIGYRMAGKTGTAQVISMGQDEKYDAEALKERQRDQALFIGFAPVENPQIAIAVLVENSGHGGEQSAPVARVVLDAYFDSEARRMALTNNDDQNDNKPLVDNTLRLRKEQTHD